jgi:hypothetical protein
LNILKINVKKYTHDDHVKVKPFEDVVVAKKMVTKYIFKNIIVPPPL